MLYSLNKWDSVVLSSWSWTSPTHDAATAISWVVPVWTCTADLIHAAVLWATLPHELFFFSLFLIAWTCRPAEAECFCSDVHSWWSLSRWLLCRKQQRFMIFACISILTHSWMQTCRSFCFYRSVHTYWWSVYMVHVSPAHASLWSPVEAAGLDFGSMSVR